MVFKRKARRAYRGFKRSRGRRSGGSSSGMSPMNVLLAGAIYGAARPMVSKFMPDLFSVGPVDSDNVLIGVAGYYGMKKGSGLMKALGTVALGSEAGIVTARLSQGMLSNVAPQSSNNGVDPYNY